MVEAELFGQLGEWEVSATVPAAELLKRQVSFFSPGKLGNSYKPELPFTVHDGLREIKSQLHYAKVLKHRELLALGKTEGAKRIKAGMSAVTWSACFKDERKKDKPHTPSGILALDFDDVGEAAKVRDRIGKDRHVLAAWVTIGGNGVRVLVLIQLDTEHGMMFTAARDYFKAAHGLDADEQCKDITRLGFQCWDAGIVINAGEIEVVGVAEVTHPSSSIQSITLYPEIPKDPIQPVNPVSQCAGLMKVQAQIEAALKKGYNKRQWIIFERFFADRHADPGERNKWVVDTVTANFCVVAEFVLLKLCMAFYDMNAGRYKTGRAEHEAEVIAMIACRAKSFAAELLANHFEVYAQLDDQKKAVFRICRDMAARNFKKTGKPEFFMSANEMAARLECHQMEADRILKKLYGAGVLDLVTKGTQTTATTKGIATTWKWLP